MKKNSKQLEENAKEMFELLRTYINENVNMVYYRYGRPEVKTGILQELHDFICVNIGGLNIPFIGYQVAIIRITSMDGLLLYTNQDPKLDLETEEQIYEAKKQAFGEDIVNEEIRKRKEALDKYNKENNPINIQRSKLTLQKEGIPYIIPGLVGEWLEFVEKNGIGVDSRTINAIIETMKDLAMEVPYEEIATKIIEDFALLDYQQIAVVNYVAHFSRLGEDFKNYWNTIHHSEDIELNKIKR